MQWREENRKIISFVINTEALVNSKKSQLLLG